MNELIVEVENELACYNRAFETGVAERYKSEVRNEIREWSAQRDKVLRAMRKIFAELPKGEKRRLAEDHPELSAVGVTED